MRMSLGIMVRLLLCGFADQSWNHKKQPLYL